MCTFNSYSFNNTHVKQPIVYISAFSFLSSALLFLLLLNLLLLALEKQSFGRARAHIFYFFFPSFCIPHNTLKGQIFKISNLMLFAFRPLPRFGRLLNLLATKSKRNRCIYHRRQNRGFVVAGVGEVVGEENPSSSRDKNKREKRTRKDALHSALREISNSSSNDDGSSREQKQPDGRFRETAIDKAKSQALRFLAAKPRTKKELELKLVEDKGYEVEDAREALEEIERLGLHSDKLYSEQWARMKWRQSRWNKWKVASELKRRGVDENDVEDGLWKVYADWERSLREELLNACRDYEDACSGVYDDGTTNNNSEVLRFTHESDVSVSGAEGEDESAVVGKRASELFASARKQWVSGASARYLKDDSEAKTRRLFAWLQRRGFDHNVARIVAETLKEEDQRERWRREEEEEKEEESVGE
jgi:SOS response regulatory protein OraA/RecX